MNNNLIMIFLTIIIFSYLPSTSNESKNGWITVDSLVKMGKSSPYNTSFLGIRCIDTLNCIAFGHIAFVNPINRITTDGGISWFTNLYDSVITIEKEPGNYDVIYMPSKMFDLSYPNENFCIATCDSGYYWLSNNIFNDWRKYKINTHRLLYSVDFFDDKYGITASDEAVYITRDGCMTWDSLNIDVYLPDSLLPFIVMDEEFVDNQTFFLLCYDKKYGRFVIKSSDMGKNFRIIFRAPMSVDRIYFINKYIGFLCGGPKVNTNVRKDLIYKTTDGGETWRSVLYTIVSPKWGIINVRFCDELNGIAFGGYNKLWRTSDGGETWNLDTTFLNVQNYALLTDIAYPARNVVFACSDNWSIFKYEENSTGILEPITVSESEDMWISPNPVKEDFNISFYLDNPSEIEIYIYDITGELKQKIIAGFRLQGINSLLIPSEKLQMVYILL